MLTAGEFCNREVVFATAHERVTEVAKRMRDHHVGSVVVVEERAEGRVPIGVLTDRDIVVGLIALEPAYLERALVNDICSPQVTVAHEGEDLYAVMTRMRLHGLRRLPVVNRQNVLQGLIAFDDLLDHVAEELNKLAAILERQQNMESELRPSAFGTR